MIIEPSTSSGKLTVTAASTISTRPSLLTSVTVTSDGVNDATITVYDNPSAASGTVLCLLQATATQSTFMATVPIYAKSGITVAITGTNATGYVTYSLL